MSPEDLSERYIEYSATLNEVIDIESRIHNKRRLLQNLSEILKEDDGNDGSFGIDFSAHAFKQISERLEEIAMANNVIYRDVYKEDSPSDSLLRPSNLKSFIITLLAHARKKGSFTKEESKSKGEEFRYVIDMKKWSNEKLLQFVAIVENNKIKTGFFNWV